MSRDIDALPENRLVSGIRSVHQTAAEFKSAQRASGASGQLGYAIANDSEWDRIEAVTSPGGIYANLVITYTGDGSQRWPIVMPLFDLRINGTAESNKLAYDDLGRLAWHDGDFFVAASGMTELDLTLIEDPYQSRWNITISGRPGTITYYLKARGQGSSDGTWTVERV